MKLLDRNILSCIPKARYYISCSKAAFSSLLGLKKSYDSVMMEVLYNILIEFGIPMKLVKLIKMCLNETYSRVRVGKSLSDMFAINLLKTKRNQLYIRYQSVPRSKHFLPRL